MDNTIDHLNDNIPENVPPALERNENPINQMNDNANQDLPIMHITNNDPDIVALANFTRREFMNPVLFALLSVAAFWTISIHGNLLIYLILQTMIYIAAIMTVKDYERPPRRGVLNLQDIDARMIQLMMLQTLYFFVDLLSFLTLRFRYFNVQSKTNTNSNASVLEQIDNFFSDSFFTVKWHVYVKISNQIFWIAFMSFFVSRMVIVLCMMCRTPFFRIILRFEAEKLISSTLSSLLAVITFNHFAATSSFGSYFPFAVFLTMNLILWNFFVILKFTKYCEELDIPRTNDFTGILKIMEVSLCQTSVCGILFSGWDMLETVISFSARSLDGDVVQYLRATKNKTYKPMNTVIELNMHVVGFILSVVICARFVVHYRKIKELETAMERIEMPHA